MIVIRKTQLFLFSLLIPLFGCNQTTYEYPFQNPKLSAEERAADLVSRLTLEEKVPQMLNNAPAIERLGIPSYNWWNECLHGIGRSDYKVTVFPQAIGMAATWNAEALKKMAEITSTEGRAIYNDASSKGNRRIYHGLTYWTPNINIFRDPRWGRGQETYGEDPYLTGTLGKAFVAGLQGDDEHYLKAAACAKHYAVHSGPEPERHVFDITVSPYDLWDTYLPAFRDLVVDAQVAGVMCAYNAYEGKPCCGNNQLMQTILREKWKFTGYVTSDCGAIDDFYKTHKTHPDAMTAAADAVYNGTDVDCGNEAFFALKDAVEKGLLPESKVDESLTRLFTIRFRLGLFDPAEINPYAQIPISVLESQPHQEHALEMAHQSIVLLKNDNNTLPLRKNLKKIVVLGPNADNETTLLGNYNGFPSEMDTPLDAIKKKVGSDVEIVYIPGANFTDMNFIEKVADPGLTTAKGEKGLQAEYFKNTRLSGTPETSRTEQELNHSWQADADVVDDIKAKDFSARWTTVFQPKESGTYSIELGADDGCRLYVNGKLCIDDWSEHAYRAKTYKLNATAGTKYNLKIEYYQAAGEGSVKLNINRVKELDAVLAQIKDADAAIFIGGISPELEGEQMPVDVKGFNGGDRTTIALPEAQTNLMKSLVKANIPTIFVMMTGSALAIDWEAQNIPAIINAWYGGQAAGTAIADVLFGDYNPAGRLPVTFYRSDSDLPDFHSYDMTNRTYRYFKGEALFPFGYGLSYTSFDYDNLKVADNATTQGMDVSIDVKNSGSMDGEEVVQLYVTHETDQRAPLFALKGFERIKLKAGESKTVKFHLSPRELALVNEKGESIASPGTIKLTVGGCSPTVELKSKGLLKETTVQVAGEPVYLD